MTLERLTKGFADLRLSVHPNAAVLEQANELLDSVNRQFAELHEDWVTQPEPIKVQKFNMYLQAQADFHTIGAIIIHEIDPAVEIPQPNASIQQPSLRFGDFNQELPTKSSSSKDETPPTQQQVANELIDDQMEHSSVDGTDEASATTPTPCAVNTLSFAQQTELYAAIFELPKLGGLDSNTIERVIRAIQKTVASIERKNIELDRSTVYTIILHVMASLDQETRTCWKYCVMNVEPTFDFLVGFLLERQKDAGSTKPSPSNKYVIPKLSAEKRPSPQPGTSLSRSSSVGSIGAVGGKKKKPNRPPIKCPLCQENHKLCECPAFRKLPLEQREIEVVRLYLCKNCFSADHGTGNCPKGACRSCEKRHNSLLHHR